MCNVSETVLPIYINGQCPIIKTCSDVTLNLSSEDSKTDSLAVNRGIKHDFPFINIRKVPREVLKTEGVSRGFQPSVYKFISLFIFTQSLYKGNMRYIENTV